MHEPLKTLTPVHAFRTSDHRNPEAETCQSCLFYRTDGDDIGTCTISDNIVEPQQDACNNHQDNTNQND